MREGQKDSMDHLDSYRLTKVEEAITAIHEMIAPLQDFVISMKTTVRIALFVVAPIVAITQTVLAALIISYLLSQ